MSSLVTIPIIDLEPFLNGTQDDKLRVAQEIAQACSDIGFFVVRNHGVNKQIIDDTWNTTMDFFDLPIEEKVKTEKNQDEVLLIYVHRYTVHNI
jgi:isopenicillin N synthase-like dioxygenase